MSKVQCLSSEADGFRGDQRLQNSRPSSHAITSSSLARTLDLGHWTLDSASGLRMRLVVNLNQFFHGDVSVDLRG